MKAISGRVAAKLAALERATLPGEGLPPPPTVELLLYDRLTPDDSDDNPVFATVETVQFATAPLPPRRRKRKIGGRS